MKKFIKKTIRRLLIGLILLSSAIWFIGYKEYQSVIEKDPLINKVEESINNAAYLEYEEIPSVFLDAIVSIEDERFYKRSTTLDPEAVLRAFWVNLKNFSFLQGASTIPQQTAKNLYYGHEMSMIRKVSEYYLTKDLLENYSKEEILTLYINIIYYGNGATGLYQASQNYFGLDVASLNEGELTLLAGLPQAPSVYDLTQNFKLAKERQIQVLNRMVYSEKITQEQADDYYHMEVYGYEEND